MSEVLDEFGRHGVVPVLTVPDPDLVDDLGDALVAGGLPLAEVTLRTPAAVDVLSAMAARGDLLVGAGTVTSVAQADAAVEAGAQFIVSPGLDADLVQHCTARGITIVPGVATATELQAAVRGGATVVKLFPAEVSGGLALVRALSAPFPDVRFVPTGGITLDLLAGYLANPAVLAVGGSWLATSALLADKDWHGLAGNCRRVVDVVAIARDGARR